MEQQAAVALGFFLAFGILYLFFFVFVAVQVGNAVYAGVGGLAEQEDLVTVIRVGDQTGGRRNVNVFPAPQRLQFFFLVLGLLQGNKNLIPDLRTEVDLFVVRLDGIQIGRYQIECLETLLRADFPADKIAVREFLFGNQTDFRSADCTGMLCHEMYLLKNMDCQLSITSLPLTLRSRF